MIRATFLTLLGFAFIGAGIWILLSYESLFSIVCSSILIGMALSLFYEVVLNFYKIFKNGEGKNTKGLSD